MRERLATAGPSKPIAVSSSSDSLTTAGKKMLVSGTDEGDRLAALTPFIVRAHVGMLSKQRLCSRNSQREFKVVWS